MGRFFLIRNRPDSPKKQYEQPRLLRSACDRLNVEYVEIISSEATLASLPTLESGDILFRNTSSARAKLIERILMKPGVITFYKNDTAMFSERRTSFFQNHQDNIPVIPTYPLLPTTRAELVEAVEYVGGFPLVFKVMGSSHGVGVIKVDSLESFKSIVDYFLSVKSSVLIRQFIPHEYFARLIVVGDRVVASNRTRVPDGEFRSNTSENTDANREPFVCSDEVNQIAVDAVLSNGLEFGGVDIIFDKENRPFVAEINFPCQFEFAQRITGIDVALEMVSYLVKKASAV